jgi:hypothetical protein
MSICNQILLKDNERDVRYLASAKCLVCGETSDLGMKFPIPLEQFTSFLGSFTKLHTDKGCNKKEYEKI